MFEGVFQGRRLEMQLKGGGPTPYCRGGDGRAVLRSSVREFLAQEHMHALGIPTSRSLTLYASTTETVVRPWYAPESRSSDSDILVKEPVAIATRVAPSFLRVGQLELFARRVRANAHPGALEELRLIVAHLIEREYRAAIDPSLPFAEQLVELARCFRERLTSLVANWLRVGYCQGNFNSDNCAAGGFTLDYGPFGFCERFDPAFQPWTGGGDHFAFFNQPAAAEANFHMFWSAVRPLLAEAPEALERFDAVRQGFADAMESRIRIQAIWASKLGLDAYDPALVQELLQLMVATQVDYTLLFRALSALPEEASALQRSFYFEPSEPLAAQWQAWLQRWRDRLDSQGDPAAARARMQQANPKLTWREWLVVPAYQQAAHGDYALVRELQEALTHPYDEPSPEIEARYCRLRPEEYFNAGGVSHYSCSS